MELLGINRISKIIQPNVQRSNNPTKESNTSSPKKRKHQKYHMPRKIRWKAKKGKDREKKKGKRMIMKAYIDIDKMPRCLKINTIISNFRL